MHDLTRSIDATFGRGEDIDRTRRSPAFDAAVGQIKTGLGHVQKRKVSGMVDRQQSRRIAAGATRQARCEVDIALGVGGGLAQNFVIAGDQADLYICHRLCR